MSLHHQQIRSKDVLPPSPADDIHPETRSERFLRTMKELLPVATASVVVLIGFIVLLVVLFGEHPTIDKHKDEAWTVMVTLIAAAGGFMFGRATA